MPRGKLIDRGEELCTVYPEVIYKDKDGKLLHRAGKEGKQIRVTVSEERRTASDLIGQVSVNMIRCVARYVPGWDWARVVFRGEEWDIVTPPHISSGSSRAIRHYEFVLRSRNGMNNMGTGENGGNNVGGGRG